MAGPVSNVPSSGAERAERAWLRWGLLRLGWKKWTGIGVLIITVGVPLVYYSFGWNSVSAVSLQLASVTRSLEQYPTRYGQSFEFHVVGNLISHATILAVNLRYPAFCATADSYILGCIFNDSASLKPGESVPLILYWRTGFSDDPSAPMHFNQTRTSLLRIHMYAVTTAGWYNETINRDETITWTAS